MNQNKYSRLLETLKKCKFPEAEQNVEEFRLFMKHQKLNNKIDTMMDEAHRKKISDEEFKAMIDEQKQIMRDLGVKLKEPPSPVKKPSLSESNNQVPTPKPTPSPQPKSEEPKPTPSPQPKPVPQTKPDEKTGDTIKIYNMNQITNYMIDGDRYYLFGPNKEKVKKVKLSSGEVVNVNEITEEQQDELSEDLEDSGSLELPPLISGKIPNDVNTDKQRPIPTKPATAPVKKLATAPVKKPATAPVKKPVTAPVKNPPVKKPATAPVKNPIAKKPLVKKPTKKNTKPKIKRTKRKYNKYWYHQIPEYPMKNITKVKGKRLRLQKRKTVKKPLKEVSEKGERIPFRGFLDYFKM
jgi:hypothetical protein